MVFDSYIRSQSQRPKHTARLPIILAIAVAITVPAAAVVIGLWSNRRISRPAVSKESVEQPSPTASASPAPAASPAPVPDEGPAPSTWEPLPNSPSLKATSAPTAEQLAARTDIERSTQNFGPFSIDGHVFTVKVSLLCFKGAKPDKPCDSDSTTPVFLEVLDESGNQSYSESFNVSLPNPGKDLEDWSQVQAALFNGKEHKILALVYQTWPAAPGTGGSFRFLAVRDGSLTVMNSQPVDCGEASSLLGVSKGNISETNLLPGEMLNIADHNTYFFFYRQLRVNWQDFRLEEKMQGDFEVSHNPTTLQTDSAVQVFASANANAAQSAMTLPAGTKVEFLGMRLPNDGHEWLRVRINGKEGWITGDESYHAVGLKTFVEAGVAANALTDTPISLT